MNCSQVHARVSHPTCHLQQGPVVDSEDWTTLVGMLGFQERCDSEARRTAVYCTHDGLADQVELVTPGKHATNILETMSVPMRGESCAINIAHGLYIAVLYADGRNVGAPTPHIQGRNDRGKQRVGCPNALDLAISNHLRYVGSYCPVKTLLILA